MSYSIKVCFTTEDEKDLFSATVEAIEEIGSHMLIKFVDMDGVEKISHAIDPGVVLDPTQEYLKTHTIVAEFEVPLWCTQEQYCKWAHAQFARKIPYAMKQMVNQAARIIGLPMVFVKNGDAEQICNEWGCRNIDLYGKVPHNFDVLDAIGLKQSYDILDTLVKQAWIRRVK